MTTRLTMTRWQATLSGAALLVAAVAPAAAAWAASSAGDVGFLRERLGTQWVATRTPSARVFVRPGSWPDLGAMIALETKLQSLAALMQVEAASLASLRERPIEYFLVDEPGILESFGAGDIEGLAYPEHRLIVSKRLPHEHELVHVLLHLRLPGRRGDNQPFLQEGLASYLGGNGADGELTVLAHGDRLLADGAVDLASLWTVAGWQSGRLEAYDRYAVAARFVQFLVEEAGDFEQLRQLARLLAGEIDAIAGRPWSILRVQIEGVYDIDWLDLVRDFEHWRSEHPVAGVREVTAPERRPDLTVVDERHRVRVWIEPGGWVVAARALRGSLDAELYWGEAQPGVPGLTSAPSVSRRYRLELDAQGLVLTDRWLDRTLLRWQWPNDPDDAGPGPIDSAAARERVWQWGTELTEQLGSPAPLGLWSRPLFSPR